MCGNVLDLKLVLESLHDILSLNLFHLLWCILLDKLIDVHVSSAHSHQDGIPLLYFDVNAFLSKLIHPLRLSQEHDVHFFSLWICVKVPGKRLIGLVILPCDVHGLPIFKSLIDIKKATNFGLECGILLFHFFKLLKEVKLDVF